MKEKHTKTAFLAFCKIFKLDGFPSLAGSSPPNLSKHSFSCARLSLKYFISYWLIEYSKSLYYLISLIKSVVCRPNCLSIAHLFFSILLCTSLVPALNKNLKCQHMKVRAIPIEHKIKGEFNLPQNSTFIPTITGISIIVQVWSGNWR